LVLSTRRGGQGLDTSDCVPANSPAGAGAPGPRGAQRRRHRRGDARQHRARDELLLRLRRRRRGGRGGGAADRRGRGDRDAAIGYPLYELVKPDRPAPFNIYPWIALGVLVAALLWGAYVYRRDPALGERVGSIVADAD